MDIREFDFDRYFNACRQPINDPFGPWIKHPDLHEHWFIDSRDVKRVPDQVYASELKQLGGYFYMLILESGAKFPVNFSPAFLCRSMVKVPEPEDIHLSADGTTLVLGTNYTIPIKRLVYKHFKGSDYSRKGWIKRKGAELGRDGVTYCWTPEQLMAFRICDTRTVQLLYADNFIGTFHIAEQYFETALHLWPVIQD